MKLPSILIPSPFLCVCVCYFTYSMSLFKVYEPSEQEKNDAALFAQVYIIIKSTN